MAEEKKVVAESSKQEVKADTKKKSGFLAKVQELPAKIAKSFKNMWYELKKVTWPSKRKWLVYSGIVLVFMLCMAVVIGLIDMGASALVRWLGTIA